MYGYLIVSAARARRMSPRARRNIMYENERVKRKKLLPPAGDRSFFWGGRNQNRNYAESNRFVTIENVLCCYSCIVK